MIAIINKLVSKYQTFFNEKAKEVANSTNFVQRESKMTGSLFLQTLVFGFIEEPGTSLTDLAETARELGVDITKQGLGERIRHAVPFLKRMFQDSLELFRNDLPLDLAVLKQFRGIFITDSTVIDLPASLQTEFPGCGGDGPQAAVKVQLCFELLHGNVECVTLEAGRSPDQSYDEYLKNIQSCGLYINDLGYFVLSRFRDIHEQQAYFLSRFNTQTMLFDPQTGPSIDLLSWLRAQTTPIFEKEWLLGTKERLPCRVLGVQVPQEVADQRRRRARETARRKGRTPSARHLELMAWSIYITNVPATLLTSNQVLSLYPVRWQIELLFKLWKSQCELDRIAGWQRERILSELYAKLIGIVVTQFLLSPFRWRERELSAVKSQQIVRRYAIRLAQSLGVVAELAKLLDRIITHCLNHATKDKRQKRQSTFEKLNRTMEPLRPNSQPGEATLA
jgi:hypothetical protein